MNALDKIYGEYHKRTTSTRYQLAVFLRKQSKHTDSLQLFLQVLESEKVIYGENDTSLAMTYWNISLCYRKLEQYQQACEYCYLCWQLECIETENCDLDVLYTFQILCSDLLKSNQYQMIIDLIVPIKEELLHGSKNRSNEQKKYISYFVELEKQVSAFIV